MIFNTDISSQVAKFLLDIQAVILKPSEPFKWASGWNSPIYCDNRLILSYPKVRNFIIDSFIEVIKNNFQETDVILGVATAGIPHATLIADRLNLPSGYIRPTPKAHGTGKAVEGRLDVSQNPIIVEDLISTGKSSFQAIEQVRLINNNIKGLLSVFDYGFDESKLLFEKEKILLVSLTDFNTISKIALESSYISSSEKLVLDEWRKSPDTWMK